MSSPFDGRLAITPAEFAEACGFSISKLYRDEKAGKIKMARFGGAARVTREEGERYIAAGMEERPRQIAAARPSVMKAAKAGIAGAARRRGRPSKADLAARQAILEGAESGLATDAGRTSPSPQSPAQRR